MTRRSARQPDAPAWNDGAWFESEPPPVEPGERFALVAINRPIAPLWYRAPAKFEIVLGGLVAVPLRGELVNGCIVEMRESLPAELIGKADKARPIRRVVSPTFHIPKPLRDLASWIADYYICGWGEALSSVSAIGFSEVAAKTTTSYSIASPQPDAKLSKRRREQFAEIAALLPSGDSRDALLAAGIRSDAIRALVVAGFLVARDDVLPPKSPLAHLSGAGLNEARPSQLTPAQLAALDKLLPALERHEYLGALLEGVTGSGKTEVYLRVIERALELGRSAIVLVPEIALTPQTVERFHARFGSLVAVKHSRLSLAEQWKLDRAARAGVVRIVVGARSALFTALPDLGVIVVDEEHEATYKQDAVPRYHARDVALVRGRLESAVTILGSATPTAESVINAERGKLLHLLLPDRATGADKPTIDVIDMAAAMRRGDVWDHLSGPLLNAIDAALSRGEHALLLLNRRGFFAFVFCPTCRAPVRCPQCDVALTLHLPDTLQCHWCGHAQAAATQCPTCGGVTNRLGLGTERLEHLIRERFPNRRIMRLDHDTTRAKHALDDAWAALANGEVDILLGTQMIAKGLHLERVTVVGIVLADLALHQPDFRASERAFALMTQVAGRAGRGRFPGKVFLQTYCPEHHAVRYAAEQDHAGFLREELARRRLAGFPPFNRLLAITISGDNPVELLAHADAMRDALTVAEAADPNRLAVFGPLPPPVARVRGQHRRRLLLRGPSSDVLRNAARHALDAVARLRAPAWSAHAIVIDVDPQDAG